MEEREEKGKRKRSRRKERSRREFLKSAGLVAGGMGTVALPNCCNAASPATPGPTQTAPQTETPPAAAPAPLIAELPFPGELPVPGQRKVPRTEFDCDVLVIGAGYAGTMAAVKAASMGQKVIVVNKQITGKAGLSPWANTMLFFDEALGDKRENWIEGFQSGTEYLIDLDYLDLFMSDSLARYKEWMAFGIVNPYNTLPSQEDLLKYINGSATPTDRRLIWPSIFKSRGIPVVERVMLTNLLVTNGAVMGAMGFHMESDEILIFRSKAVVICAGAGGFKGSGAFPINGNTNDGDWMAYQVGARVGGKSWEDFHGGGGLYPADSWGQGDERFIGRIYATVPPTRSASPSRGMPGGMGFPALHKEGARVPKTSVQTIFPPDHLTNTYSYTYKPVDQNKWENVRYDSDAYHPPNTWPAHPSITNPQPPDPYSANGGATGLGIHCAEGIYPADSRCWSGIPGLYAAGDALCSRLCGSKYTAKGVSSSSAGVFGYRAGEAAAKYAAGTSAPVVSADQISSIQNEILAPRKLTKGYSPRWIQEVLLATMAPYFILKMKHKNRLQGALENVSFMRDHLVPKAMAADPHELRLCHEVRHMALNAEMKLRQSLAREESRGTHWREDFPYRDDKNWLAWQTCQKDSKGNMVVDKVPVPDRMKTDKDKPYKERYAISFPGEEEAIAKLGIK